MSTFIGKSAALSGRTTLVAVALSLGAVAIAGRAEAQTVLLKDSFGFWPITPAGGTRFDAAGNFAGITLHADLSGLRAEFPFNSSEVWTGPTGHHGAPTWGFSVSSADPYEQYGTVSEPTPNNNGTMTCLFGPGTPYGGADELLDFTPPGGAFQMSLDVVGGGVSTAIGFTSSGTVVNDNFPTFGEIWMVLHGGGGQGGIGNWELHTHGLSGPSVSGTTVLGGYNPLAISYDPATHIVRGSVNGVLTPTISYSANGIHAVGFEGLWTVNNFVVLTGELGGGSSSVTSYCTSSTTTTGCNPAMQASAQSASIAGGPGSFVVSCDNIPGLQSGVIFYGIHGRDSTVWGTGSTSFLCVKTPLVRATVGSAGGTAGLCDGALSFDFFAFMATHPSAAGNPLAIGQTFDAQAWFRDPPAPKTTNLSNGLEFTLTP